MPAPIPRPTRRSDTDACPGALRLHAAADGPLARVRLPGGQLTGDQLAVLGDLAERWGDGGLELTSRANVQLRALTEADPDELAAILSAAGLLPRASHETVRNIAAPALAAAPTRALVADLDRGLCADPALAGLPGRFLFAIGEVPLDADVAAVPVGAVVHSGADNGVRVPPGDPDPDPADAAVLSGADNGLRVPPGDPADPAFAAVPTGADAGLRVPPGDPAFAAVPASADTDLRVPPGDPAGAAFAVVLAGVDTGLRVLPGDVVPALLAAAHAFLAERAETPGKPAWRLRELPGGPARVARRLADALGPARFAATAAATSPSSAGPALIGVVAQGDGRFAAGALVPLGRLDARAIRVLARAGRVVITPARGVVVPDLPAGEAEAWVRRLAAAGLAVETDSRWAGVTACAGRPGCAKSLADVRADADAATRHVPGLPVHWVGCARGCGSPAGPHVRVEATPAGYVVTREPAEAAPGLAGPAAPGLAGPAAPASTGPTSLAVADPPDKSGAAAPAQPDPTGVAAGDPPDRPPAVRAAAAGVAEAGADDRTAVAAARMLADLVAARRR